MLFSMAESKHAAAVTTPSEESVAIEAMLSKVPSGEGYYAKIYKAAPLPHDFKGTIQLLEQIPDPGAIDDMESHLYNLAHQRGWGAGLYEVRIFRHGSRGVQFRPVRVSVNPPAEPITPATTHESARGVVEKAAETLIAKAVDRIVDPPAAPAAAPAVSPDIMASIVTALVNRFMAPAADPTEQLLKLAELRDRLTPAAPTVNPGAPSPPGRVQTLAEKVEEIKSVAALLPSLVGNAAAPTGPTWAQVILEGLTRLFPNGVDQVIANLTQTWNRAMDLRIAKAAGGDSGTAAPVRALSPELEGLARQFRAACDRNDPTAFPGLALAVARDLPEGSQFLDLVARGQIVEAQALEMLSATRLIPATSAARAYAARFFAFLRNRAGAPAGSPPASSGHDAPDGLLAVCEACHMQYSFAAPAEWENELEQRCDDCGGMLRLATA